MNNIGILLKKELGEKFSSFKNKKKDILGGILSTALILIVVGVFCFAFIYLAQTYVNVKVGFFTNVKERAYEICTVFFAVLLCFLSVVGVFKLNKGLIDVSNLTMLSLPVTPFQIFFSKIVVVFIELVVTSVVISVPIFTILSALNITGVFSIFVALLYSILLPVIALGIASIFTIPVYYVKKWLSSHFVISVVVYVAFIGIAFVCYSMFLKLIKTLLGNGQIQFFFNESLVNNIGSFCKAVFPSNLFSGVIFGKNVLLNLFLIIIITAVFGAVCFYLGKVVFYLVRYNKIGKTSDFIKTKKARNLRGTTKSLVAKEFLHVLRTPSYAFSYFAIILSLPLMVTITANIMCSMMKELTLLNCDFEIILCTLCMYSVLLNSFCANNITRDGKFFNLVKTFPISPKKLIFSKILFCSITSFTSIVFSGLAILGLNQLSSLKVLAMVVICCLINFAIICIATRKDLNTAKLNNKNENSASTSFLIFWGLMFSVSLTVISFLCAIYLQVRFNLLVSGVFTCFILLLVSLIMCGLSVIYLLKNLDKKFKETIL